MFGAAGGGSGTGNTVNSEGNYFFYNSLVLYSDTSPTVPEIKTVRMTTNVGVTIVDEDDTIDDRLDPIDEWTRFDGADGDDGDVIVYYRTTQDVNVSPEVWTEWAPFNVAEVSCMGAEFKADLLSYDGSVNVLVDTLEIIVDEVTQ